MSYKKVGILWGGGLGDLLMIRPLIQALHKNGAGVTFISSAKHATHLFPIFCDNAEQILLPDKVLSQISFIKQLHNRFDLIYIGPYPTILTQIYARLISRHVWHRLHNKAQEFVMEQVLSDIEAMGLEQPTEKALFVNSLPWSLIDRDEYSKEPYYVIHPGAKPGWVTKQWPIKKWSALINALLDNKGCQIYITGVKDESTLINKIISGVDKDKQINIKALLSTSLDSLAQAIHSSHGVICHNSGVMNLAILLKKKTVVLNGSSANYWRAPYPWVLNLTSGKCNIACNQYRCPIPSFDAKCIKALQPEDVYRATMQHFINPVD